MPDTKIKRITGKGWIDVDQPNNFYGVRRLARDARRDARRTRARNAYRTAVGRVLPGTRSPTQSTTFAASVVYSPGPGQPNTSQSLSGLQQRLFDRMTTQQFVLPTEALEVIAANTYNKTASYGHMREAGANHGEAKIVIGLDSPDTSLAYGIARAKGMLHTDALNYALRT